MCNGTPSQASVSRSSLRTTRFRPRHDTVQQVQSATGQTAQCMQWFFFSRNIGQLTPKIIYFHYLKKSFLDQSIQKKINLILKTEALLHTLESLYKRKTRGARV